MDKPCPTPAKTYQQASIGEALDKDYGVVKGGPSRNRRAGMIVVFRTDISVHMKLCGGCRACLIPCSWALSDTASVTLQV